jgi:diguanylate cyclase
LDLNKIKKNKKLYYKILEFGRLAVVSIPYIVLFILTIITLVYKRKILSIGLGITIALIMIRQIITALENKKLLKDLYELNFELEYKVKLRTKELEESTKLYKNLFEKNAYAANHDELTGLPNRRFLQRKIEEALCNKSNECGIVAVMFMDLDKFKWVNDNLGHDIGDQLLVDVANRIKGCTRKSDLVVRQGGDEFIILLMDVNSTEDVESAAQRIVEVISKTFFVSGHKIEIGCSIGIAMYPDDTNNPMLLMKKADLAMYNVKESGKNGYQFY